MQITTFKYSILGIDEAHELALLMSRGSSDAHSLNVTCVDITTEAQNALLKILEAPAAGMLLTLHHPNPSALLPTLRSRAGAGHFEIYKLEAYAREHSDVKAFLKAEGPARLKLIAPLVVKMDEPEEKLAQREEASAFLLELEQEAYKIKDWPLLEEIERGLRHVAERELPVRVIMEHIALMN
ncbi:MAG: hypothetical protein A3I39_03205 [Candidatus Yanofskybacteria bacterium RIFCSPLOWO2_02_FULL_47_9b]|uniref:Uncharacterized protein n=1 Tax=Candidatus Yanofskybacteria bacterium RIFCSPLOWO2_02_FULL_47_9b TaxID=1802708 RepID=A0A1F8H8R0_9BACT|nr:MAG: hypothetical protein A3I39_03205 [Candidatus Yanofskybacteria bacterium RIFCSPLOWO2_02_FULL_47_9b]